MELKIRIFGIAMKSVRKIKSELISICEGVT